MDVIMRIGIATLAYLLMTACTTGEAIFTVSGVPGSSTILRQKAIATATDPNPSVMTRNLEQSLIAELKRSRFRYQPNNADVVIKVRADHGGRATGDSWSYQPIWGGIQTNTEQFHLINLDFQASDKGKPFWEARISGDGEYLIGELQGGCIRELLLNHLDENDSREDRCYKDGWPPK